MSRKNVQKYLKKSQKSLFEVQKALIEVQTGLIMGLCPIWVSGRWVLLFGSGLGLTKFFIVLG